MADEGSELYLENLDEFVNDEDKIVRQFCFLIHLIQNCYAWATF